MSEEEYSRLTNDKIEFYREHIKKLRAKCEEDTLLFSECMKSIEYWEGQIVREKLKLMKTAFFNQQKKE